MTRLTRTTLLLTTLAFVACHSTPPAPTNASLPPPVLHPADAALWTQRIRSLLPPGWSVHAIGDEIYVKRNEPVHLRLAPGAWSFASPADAASWAKTGAIETTYELHLIFFPRMPVEEFNHLNALNAVSKSQHEQLDRQIDALFSSDPRVPLSPESKARLTSLNHADAQLRFYYLPPYYCSNFSVDLPPACADQLVGPGGDECRLVEAVLFSLFTPYPPRAVDILYPRLSFSPPPQNVIIPESLAPPSP